ncbi:hypothetical protein TFLX_02323 [Thermoflexales bacterium]|nr:hypothetical protein TFLX_02323 [Thermoflexales bacterium]
MADKTKLYFNGINGASGDYELPPMTSHQLAQVIKGEEIDEGLLNELKQRKEAHWAVKEGFDPTQIASVGWGILMAHNADPAIREALSELLAHRQKKAGERYREYLGPEGYRPDETKNKWLGRHGMGPGPADPDKVPYYLLIVGDPEAIPYRFQNQLDVQYAVGRIHFDTLDEYAAYARSVVQAETGGLALPKQATFFGVRTSGDQATQLSADHMIKPLSAKMGTQSGWQINTLLEAQATKANLSDLINSGKTPTLLYTASHGLGFPNNDPRQFPHQGALLCQDWPGPGKWKQAIPTDFYFSADDVSDDARLLGSMAFFFACYGAGTPRWDEFAQQASKQRAEIAPRAFLAQLPRRLLSHPQGGMLAVVGHVERAWGYSFMWDRAGEQLTTFESALLGLLADKPIGHALDYFNTRYAEISSDLTAMIEDLNFGGKVDEVALAGMWTANNDARAYVIIGDPAVRLPVSDQPAQAQRPVIEAVTLSNKPVSTVTATAAATLTPTSETNAASFEASAFSFAVQEERSSLTDSIKKFTSELADSLKRAADDISSLEVVTYSTDDLSKVTYDYNDRQLHGELRMRALTRIAFDGDVQVCVPEKNGNIDQAVWDVHLSMVQAAQENRAAFLATMAELATKLIGLLGGK